MKIYSPSVSSVRRCVPVQRPHDHRDLHVRFWDVRLCTALYLSSLDSDMLEYACGGSGGPINPSNVALWICTVLHLVLQRCQDGPRTHVTEGKLDPWLSSSYVEYGSTKTMAQGLVYTRRALRGAATRSRNSSHPGFAIGSQSGPFRHARE